MPSSSNSSKFSSTPSLLLDFSSSSSSESELEQLFMDEEFEEWSKKLKSLFKVVKTVRKSMKKYVERSDGEITWSKLKRVFVSKSSPVSAELVVSQKLRKCGGRSDIDQRLSKALTILGEQFLHIDNIRNTKNPDIVFNFLDPLERFFKELTFIEMKRKKVIKFSLKVSNMNKKCKVKEERAQHTKELSEMVKSVLDEMKVLCSGTEFIAILAGFIDDMTSAYEMITNILQDLKRELEKI